MLSSNSTLSNGGLVYLMLKDWHERGAAEDFGIDQRSRCRRHADDAGGRARLNTARDQWPRHIQRLSNAARVDRWQQRFWQARLGRCAAGQGVAADPRIADAFTSLRAAVPQIQLHLNRARAESLGVSVGSAYSAIQSYLGSSYVNLFSKYGQNFTCVRSGGSGISCRRIESRQSYCAKPFGCDGADQCVHRHFPDQRAGHRRTVQSHAHSADHRRAGGRAQLGRSARCDGCPGSEGACPRECAPSGPGFPTSSASWAAPWAWCLASPCCLCTSFSRDNTSRGGRRSR